MKKKFETFGKIISNIFFENQRSSSLNCSKNVISNVKLEPTIKKHLKASFCMKALINWILQTLVGWFFLHYTKLNLFIIYGIIKLSKPSWKKLFFPFNFEKCLFHFDNQHSYWKNSQNKKIRFSCWIALTTRASKFLYPKK